MNTKYTYCRFCLSFCGLKVDLNEEGKATKVSGDSTHPVSQGYSCQKGRRIVDFYSHNRLYYPKKKGKQKLKWTDALSEISQIIQEAIDHKGADSVALYTGTNAILDATGMWAALGLMYRINSNSFYSVNSIDAINKQVAIENLTSNNSTSLIPQADFKNTDCLLLVGSNPAVSHGHLAGISSPQKQLRDLIKRGAQLIVADPRKTRTAKLANQHISPKPNTDYAWIAYLIRELLTDQSNEHIDQGFLEKHTLKLNELKQAVAPFNIEFTTKITGLPAEELQNLFFRIKKVKNLSALSGTGASFSDSGIITEWFLWSLLALKGSLDQAGGIWFNHGISRAPTAINKTTKTKSSWSKSMPSRPDLPAQVEGKPCAALADEIEAGNLKVLICIGGNPINAFPNSSKTERTLKKLDAFIVLDTHHNELVNIADYGLPVSAPLERADSTIYTSSSVPELSIAYTDAVFDTPKDVKSAWWVFAKLGEKLGVDTINLNRKADELSDLDVLKTIKGGRSYFENSPLLEDRFIIDKNKPFGWVTKFVLAEEKWCLYTKKLSSELDRILKAEFNKQSPKLRLVSMREEDHLNTQFYETSKNKKLPFAYLNPKDAIHFNLKEKQEISLKTDYGSMLAQVKIIDNIESGCIAVPHGYSGQGNVSQIISERHGINPLSGMVRQTGFAIKIETKPASI